MKKIILLLSIFTITLVSCKKETIKPKVTSTYVAGFSGYNQGSYHCFINGIEKKFGMTYTVKVGDVLKIDDTGEDIYHPEERSSGWYSGGVWTPGKVTKAAYTEQGYTSGTIVLSTTTNGTTVIKNITSMPGNVDTHLSYTIQ